MIKTKERNDNSFHHYEDYYLLSQPCNKPTGKFTWLTSSTGHIKLPLAHTMTPSNHPKTAMLKNTKMTCVTQKWHPYNTNTNYLECRPTSKRSYSMERISSALSIKLPIRWHKQFFLSYCVQMSKNLLWCCYFPYILLTSSILLTCIYTTFYTGNNLILKLRVSKN